MWISKITIKNFRKVPGDQSLSIELKEGLNLIIGENNIGKTTIIDAISLCLSYGNPEKSVWLKKDDFHDKTKPIEIILEFSGLNSSQEATFLEALVLNKKGNNHRLKFEFNFEMKDDRIYPRIKCGELGLTSNPYDLLKFLNSMYLQALRDVNLEFQPGYRSRLGKIVKRRFPKDTKSFEDIFNTANEEALKYQGKKNPVKELEGETNVNIERLSLKGDNNEIQLNFVEQEFTRILTNIVMKTKQKGLDIRTNGLGYNNLIYISTILTELKVEEIISPHTFNCLLIEEPEAHLHPQLQALLLEFLQTEYKNIQVILTSHSPTITSVINFDNLNLLVKKGQTTQSVLIKNTKLEGRNKNFLKRYLDVTKSQLFFARKIIFVEGITEAILMKAFWNYIYDKPDDKFDRQGIEVVNIQGVAFRPYIDLIRNVFNETQVKSIVITDDDRGTGKGCIESKRFKKDGNIRPTSEIVSIFDEAPLSSRANNLKVEVDKLKQEGVPVDIFLARKTFEVEFGIANERNKRFFKKIIDPDNLERLSGIELGIEVWKNIIDKDMKADFAERISKILFGDEKRKKSGTAVPQYIKNAFRFLKDD